MRCMVLLVALLAAAGCDQAVDEGKLDSGPARDMGAADQGPGGEAGTGDQALADAPGGKSVQVVYGGKTTTVYLSQPTPVTFETTPHARLSDVIKLALPAKDQAKLKADFESSDGYRPSTKSTCDVLVLKAGTVFTQGYIDVSTRKLRWDLTLKYPGCMYVKDMAKVLVTDL